MFCPKISILHCFHCCWVLTLYDLVFRQLSTWKEKTAVPTKFHVCSPLHWANSKEPWALFAPRGSHPADFISGDPEGQQGAQHRGHRRKRGFLPLPCCHPDSDQRFSQEGIWQVSWKYAGNYIVCLSLMWLWNMCYQQQDTLPPWSSLFQGHRVELLALK